MEVRLRLGEHNVGTLEDGDDDGIYVEGRRMDGKRGVDGGFQVDDNGGKSEGSSNTKSSLCS